MLKVANQTTQTIVFGYVRYIQSSFDATNKPYYNIPSPISVIILSYIDNLFDNKDEYEWKIDNPSLVNKILTAKCGDKFESEYFILCRLKCKLIIYPNGNDQELKGSFIINLFFELPSCIEKIIFVRIFRVKENMTGSTWLSTISQGEYEYWSRKCPLSELIDLNVSTITIQICFNLQRIILKNEIDKTLLKYCPVCKTENMAMKSHLEFSFSGNIMKMLKNSKDGKSMCSDIFDNMWGITIYPQGDLGKGYVDAYLTLCYLPRNVKQIVVYYKLTCDAVDDDCLYTNIFSHIDHSWGAETWFEFTVLSKLDTVSFMVDLKIQSIIYENAPPTEISHSAEIAYILSL
eukprot:481113_1